MRRAEFVKLERKVNFDDMNLVYLSHYYKIEPEKDLTGKYKNRLYLIVADVYGIPYAYEISKLMRKYTSGKTQSPRMIHYISESLERKEFYINSEGKIEDLDKILKQAVTESGYY